MQIIVDDVGYCNVLRCRLLCVPVLWWFDRYMRCNYALFLVMCRVLRVQVGCCEGALLSSALWVAGALAWPWLCCCCLVCSMLWLVALPARSAGYCEGALAHAFLFFS